MGCQSWPGSDIIGGSSSSSKRYSTNVKKATSDRNDPLVSTLFGRVRTSRLPFSFFSFSFLLHPLHPPPPSAKPLFEIIQIFSKHLHSFSCLSVDFLFYFNFFGLYFGSHYSYYSCSLFAPFSLLYFIFTALFRCFFDLSFCSFIWGILNKLIRLLPIPWSSFRFLSPYRRIQTPRFPL